MTVLDIDLDIIRNMEEQLDEAMAEDHQLVETT